MSFVLSGRITFVPPKPSVKLNRRGEGKAYKVNIRTCIAFREIGRGYDCIRTFCRSMNIPPPPPPPPPPCQSNVDKSINSILYDTYTYVASDSMQKASVEAKGTEVSSCSIRRNSVAQVVV